MLLYFWFTWYLFAFYLICPLQNWGKKENTCFHFKQRICVFLAIFKHFQCKIHLLPKQLTVAWISTELTKTQVNLGWSNQYDNWKQFFVLILYFWQWFTPPVDVFLPQKWIPQKLKLVKTNKCPKMNET